MAEYWVGPSIRRRPVERWQGRGQSVPRVGPARSTPRRLSLRRAKAFIRLVDAKLHDVTVLGRYGAHLAVLALTFAIVVVGRTGPRLPLEPEQAPASALAPGEVTWQASVADPTVLDWRAAPLTYIAQRPAVARTEPLKYTVAEGDNPTLIAQRFGLQPATLIWANPLLEENPDLLSLGQELIIPPVDGVWYTVEPGDTIEKMAERFKVDVATIVGYAPNHLQPGQTLIIGQQVMVPSGQKPYVAPPPPPTPPPAPLIARAPAAPAPALPPAPAAAAPARAAAPAQPAAQPARAAPAASTNTNTGGPTGRFRWPLVGRITQNPSSYHMALDIAAPLGTPVRASDGGTVVYAGWDNTGYGYTIVIDHGNGYRTRYAHFSWYYPSHGDRVAANELIGKVGSTGRSTGPHLHFEVLRWGSRQNPYNYLP
ncbi:MAG TPA: peptidoglycan DD-metalloendopeptidase family protein [Ardenticatenaceae bacterium]|nr:peptidoglycan DD-metalloendopeptidase family protein [Ardenticatenaceae bacterium]